MATLKNQTFECGYLREEGCEYTSNVCMYINPALCSDRATKYSDSQMRQFNLIFRPLSPFSSSSFAVAPLSRSLLSKASWPSSRCQLQVDTFAPSRAPNRFRINCTPARFRGVAFDIRGRGWQWRMGRQRTYLTVIVIFNTFHYVFCNYHSLDHRNSRMTMTHANCND